MLINITNPFIDWIFPLRCFVCGHDIAQGDICSDCLELCHRNVNSTFLTDKNYAHLFYYELTIKTLIKNIKYHKDTLSAHLILRLIENELNASPLLDEIIRFSPVAITFVPTHLFNRIRRSLDLPTLIAQLFAAKLKVPVVSLLKRTNFNNRQVSKNKRERLHEIKGAYALGTCNMKFERVLLVDDVVTTGATLAESSKVLKKICAEIRCVAVAKTP